MIKSNKIINLKIVECILLKLKETNNYINNLNDNSFEYEHLCENIEEQLCEIEKSLIGLETFNQNNRIRAILRMDNYWDYLRGDISFNGLLKKLRSNSDELLLH